MSKLTSEDWSKIESRYKLGHKLRDIEEEFGYSSGNITTKAKKMGWIHGELKHDVVGAVSAVVNLEQKLKQSPGIDTGVVLKEINKLGKLQEKSCDIQSEFLDVIKLSLMQIKQIMNNSPDGLYVKSESAQGTSYGRTTEHLKDVAFVMPAINTMMGLDKPLVDSSVTNNTQNNVSKDNKIIIQPVKVRDKDE